MNSGAWQATIPGVTRVGHNLATKSPSTTCTVNNGGTKQVHDVG